MAAEFHSPPPTPASPRCLVFIAALLGMFAVGILLGELNVGNAQRVAEVTGAVATIVVLVIGGGLVARMHGRSPLLAATVAALIVANLSYTFAAFATPVVDVLFDIGTLLVMLLLSRVGPCPEEDRRLCIHAARLRRGEG